jgi:transglutaminase-like putative cysteine protease
MSTFLVRHHTTYSYDRPVAFGAHRLMMRPRDGHDMRLLDSSLTVSPPADVRWEFDAFGNSVAVLSFHHPAQSLTVRSDLTVRRYGHDDPIGRLTRHTGPYPFAYDREESIDLTPLTALLFPDDRDALGAWLAAGIPTVPGETMALLDALVQAIHGGFAYSRRETAGVQSPAETIRLGSGTCRDFAVLFMEAARHLGFAARFVTGYLYDPFSRVLTVTPQRDTP